MKKLRGKGKNIEKGSKMKRKKGKDYKGKLRRGRFVKILITGNQLCKLILFSVVLPIAITLSVSAFRNNILNALYNFFFEILIIFFCRYKRDSSDEVDGRKSYHGGVTCIIASPPGGIVEDDLQCTASDELDPVICNLDDEEKPVSSVIDIKSMHGSLHSEVNA